MELDISAELARSEEGATMYLKDLHGNDAKKADGEPVWIKLAGTNSKLWREASDSVGNKRLARANTKIGTAAKNMAEHREDQAALYAAVTLAWDGIKVDGKPLDCTPENAKKLYMMAKFIFDQVEEFVSEQRNF